MRIGGTVHSKSCTSVASVRPNVAGSLSSVSGLAIRQGFLNHILSYIFLWEGCDEDEFNEEFEEF
jgi:hypothetical protein